MNNRRAPETFCSNIRFSCLLILLIGTFALGRSPALADAPITASLNSPGAPSLIIQQPTLALPAVPTDSAPTNANDAGASVAAAASSSNASDGTDKGTAKPPLQGKVVRHSAGAGHTLGIRSLPEGREPDYIIGHFGLYIGPIRIKLGDDSGGFYFSTIGYPEGPCGWLMPMPKREGQDKVTPWAIYFDQ